MIDGKYHGEAPKAGPEEGGTRSILREAARHTALTFFSTLAIQVTTFAILALSGLVMSTEGFADLSVIVASTMLASAFFELGLNVTSTKFYGDTRDEGYLRCAFAARWLCLLIALVLGFATAMAMTTPDVGLGIAFGGMLNIWNGLRATDQAREDYRSIVRSSVAFAAVRSLAGLAALFLTRDPVMTAIATYAVPILATTASTSARYAFSAFSRPLPPLRPLLAYATHVYLNAVAFIAIPYVPQFVINARLDDVAVGTYGLVLAFSGPVALIIYALYAVLLPKMLGRGTALEDLLWSSKGTLAISALFAAFLIGGICLSGILQWIYATRFPDIVPVFLLYFSGISLSSLLGLYSLSVHTQGVPELNVIVSATRLAILAVLLMAYANSLMSAVSITLAVLLAGQLVLIYLLWLRRRRIRAAV